MTPEERAQQFFGKPADLGAPGSKNRTMYELSIQAISEAVAAEREAAAKWIDLLCLGTLTSHAQRTISDGLRAGLHVQPIRSRSEQ